MRTDLFDFELPEGAIALHPVQPRDTARLLVVRPVKGGCAGDDADLTDKIVSDLPSLLQPGDALVFNDTRVIPAALSGIRVRGETQAKVDFNLTKRVSDSSWRAFARPAKRLEAGDRVHFGHSGDSCMMGALDATVSAKGEAGEVELAFDFSGDMLDDAIRAVGAMPLPPYIALKRDADESDRVSYQTVYASKDGAVAAPTAGLHFTPELLEALESRGVSRHFVTLHVGPGTFLPVKTDDTAAHVMHAEWGEVSAETAQALNDVRAKRRPDHSGRYDLAQASRKRCRRRWRNRCLVRRNVDFHYARLSLQGCRHFDDQLSFAALDTVHARRSVFRSRHDARRLRPRPSRRLPLLFLWRRQPAIPSRYKKLPSP